MITLENVLNTLSLYKSEIFKSYDLKELGIFGYYVKGDNKINSDVDLPVEYNVTPDLLRYIELETKIEKILNTKVDKVIRNSIRPELKNEILSEVILI